MADSATKRLVTIASTKEGRIVQGKHVTERKTLRYSIHSKPPKKTTLMVIETPEIERRVMIVSGDKAKPHVLEQVKRKGEPKVRLREYVGGRLVSEKVKSQ